MGKVTYSNFAKGLKDYLDALADNPDGVQIEKSTNNYSPKAQYQFRAVRDDENLSGHRKITGSISQIKSQLGKAFDAVANTTNKKAKRVIALDGSETKGVIELIDSPNHSLD